MNYVCVCGYDILPGKLEVNLLGCEDLLVDADQETHPTSTESISAAHTTHRLDGPSSKRTFYIFNAFWLYSLLLTFACQLHFLLLI